MFWIRNRILGLGVKIISIDYQTADKVITNEDLTKILDTSDELLSHLNYYLL